MTIQVGGTCARNNFVKEKQNARNTTSWNFFSESNNKANGKLNPFLPSFVCAFYGWNMKGPKVTSGSWFNIIQIRLLSRDKSNIFPSKFIPLFNWGTKVTLGCNSIIVIVSNIFVCKFIWVKSYCWYLFRYCKSTVLFNKQLSTSLYMLFCFIFVTCCYHKFCYHR